MKTMNLYISGPMTGYKDFNKPAFRDAGLAAVADVRFHGHVNPANVDPGVQDPQWIDFMKADIKELMDCDAIAMLPGSKHSRGARLELAIAQGLGFEVFVFSGGEFKKMPHPEEF